MQLLFSKFVESRHPQSATRSAKQVSPYVFKFREILQLNLKQYTTLVAIIVYRAVAVRYTVNSSAEIEHSARAEKRRHMSQRSYIEGRNRSLSIRPIVGQFERR